MSGQLQWSPLINNITTPGTAEILREFHVTHTRRPHQVTVVIQHILQNRAFDHACKANDNDKD
jgi:hypothetical protein